MYVLRRLTFSLLRLLCGPICRPNIPTAIRACACACGSRRLLLPSVQFLVACRFLASRLLPSLPFAGVPGRCHSSARLQYDRVKHVKCGDVRVLCSTQLWPKWLMHDSFEKRPRDNQPVAVHAISFTRRPGNPKYASISQCPKHRIKPRNPTVPISENTHHVRSTSTSVDGLSSMTHLDTPTSDPCNKPKE